MTTDLQEKERYTTALLNSTAAGVVLINSQNYRLEYVNPVAAEMIGFSPQELTGKSYYKYFSDQTESERLTLDSDVSEKKTESKILDKSGKEIYLLKTIKPIKVGKRELLIATFVDVSEIKQMQATLEKEEKKYRTMFEASPAAIILTDSAGFVVDLNNKVQLWLGYSPQDIIGKRVLELDFITKKSKMKIIQEQRKRQGEKVDSKYEIEFYDQNRKIRYGKLLVNQVYDKQQAHVLNVVTIMDITQEKQYRDEIKAQEIKYRSMFDSVGDAIFLLARGKFIDCNEAAVKMFGMKSKEDFIDTSPASISPEKQEDGANSLEKSEKLLHNTLAAGSTQTEWIHQRKDGTTFPAEVVLTKIELPNEKFIHASVRDISERKAFERSIAETRKKLQQVMNASSPIIAINADYSVADLNPAMLEILDIKNASSAIGKNVLIS